MDKVRGIASLPIVEERLGHLLKRLLANKALGSYRTQEALNRAVFQIIERMSRGHDKNIYDLPKVTAGTPPDQLVINSLLGGVYQEITYLLDVVLKTGKSVEADFNFAVSRIKKLQADLKYCYQQLGVYSLYVTGYGAGNYFAETFSNEDHVDKGSKFLAEKECFLDLTEGTVSLPRKKEEAKHKIAKISLGDRTNGVIGNNVEASVPIRGRLKALYDGNPDTWTEFERVVLAEDLEHLIVELKVSLDDKKAVNAIRVIPVLLGARTPPSIVSIELSSDGKKWISVDKEVRVAEFIGEKEDERYRFSPSGSRFAGEFSITFAPRFAKFVKIALRQSSAFPIKDTYGKRFLRYAVGIRELEIIGNKHESEGEIISKRIEFPEEIRAVSLLSLVDPPDLPVEAGGAEYFLSFDDGVSWTQVVPQDETSPDIPEVLFPPTEQTSLRYKVKLSKDEPAFAVYRREQASLRMREIFSWGDAPLRAKLRYKPIQGTINVCDPEVVTRGKSYPKMALGYGTYSKMSEDRSSREGSSVLKRKVPLLDIKDPDSVEVEVAGESFPRTDSWSAETWYSKKCQLERTSDGIWQVVFGNGDASSPKGVIPAGDQEISLKLTEESLAIETLTEPYIASLDYPSNGEKKDTTIYFPGESYYVEQEVVTPGVTKYRLRHYPVNLTSYAVVLVSRNRSTGAVTEGYYYWPAIGETHTGAGSRFLTRKNFIDGYSELKSAGDWTIDVLNGVLYFYSSTPSHESDETTIWYGWDDNIYLKSEDWDFVEGRLDQIQIYESGYHTIEGQYSIPSGGVNVITLQDGSGNAITGIVPKSVRLSSDTFVSGSTTYAPYEVPFVDGVTEFEGRTAIQDETVPAAVSGAGDIASFRLTQWQSIIVGAGAAFSDILTFKIEKTFVDGSTELTSVGDWSIDYTGTLPSLKGTVYVKLSGAGTIPSGGTVSYQYEDTDSKERMKGAYSVNLKDAQVHFAMTSAASSGLLATFRYSPYKAQYIVSYELKEGQEEDYVVDIEKRELTVNAGARGNKKSRLAVTYMYQPEDESLLSLAEYFSPLLRALAIKVAAT